MDEVRVLLCGIAAYPVIAYVVRAFLHLLKVPVALHGTLRGVNEYFLLRL